MHRYWLLHYCLYGISPTTVDIIKYIYFCKRCINTHLEKTYQVEKPNKTINRKRSVRLVSNCCKGSLGAHKNL